MKRHALAVPILAALVPVLVACGSSAPAAPAGPDNVLACQHYAVQRAWVLGLAAPSVAAAEQFEADLAADTNISDGQLNTDLNAMIALGVTFSPAP
jgi:hypothetical protein